MTLDELPEYLESLKQQIIDTAKKKAQPAAGIALEAEMKDRIFDKGQDADGNSIGTYSTTPVYATKEQFVRQGAFRPQGKNGPGKKKNGEDRRSMYLKQGYKELRDIQGRQTEKKDHNYSGSLKNSIRYLQDGEVDVIAITDPKESKKRKGLEKQSGKNIYSASEKEVAIYGDTFIEVLKSETSELIK